MHGCAYSFMCAIMDAWMVWAVDMSVGCIHLSAHTLQENWTHPHLDECLFYRARTTAIRMTSTLMTSTKAQAKGHGWRAYRDPPKSPLRSPAFQAWILAICTCLMRWGYLTMSWRERSWGGGSAHGGGFESEEVSSEASGLSQSKIKVEDSSEEKMEVCTDGLIYGWMCLYTYMYACALCPLSLF